ncbi:DUF3037 domain-containing protein [Chitinophaga deserti]|uniref:DUF3037 domain-containing protein n=1 Tax=Chitinophaga deserti TaxID=2164099 RepID=UPI000D6B127D|nr:DUF3037 domain-containing protein [Chitinophaga deserti]
MPEQPLFEYAVIRVVPKVEREEFMNVGVILFCRPKRYLDCKITLDEARLRAFSPTLDLEALKAFVTGFEKTCRGEGPIGQLDPASRFRWLTAMRSTILQTSRVHPGLCSAPEDTLDRLHRELVLQA